MTPSGEAGSRQLICRRCGTIVGAGRIAGPAPCLTPRSTKGFVVDRTQLTFRGLCRDCR